MTQDFLNSFRKKELIILIFKKKTTKYKNMKFGMNEDGLIQNLQVETFMEILTSISILNHVNWDVKHHMRSYVTNLQ